MFFRLKHRDLFDFFILCLYNQKLKGLWISLLLKEVLDKPISDEQADILLENISEAEESSYARNAMGKDFEIIQRFLQFRKKRLRLNSHSRDGMLAFHFFQSKFQNLGFLMENEEIRKWKEEGEKQIAKKKEEEERIAEQSAKSLIKQSQSQLNSKKGDKNNLQEPSIFLKYRSE